MKGGVKDFWRTGRGIAQEVFRGQRNLPIISCKGDVICEKIDEEIHGLAACTGYVHFFPADDGICGG